MQKRTNLENLDRCVGSMQEQVMNRYIWREKQCVASLATIMESSATRLENPHPESAKSLKFLNDFFVDSVQALTCGICCG